MRTFPSVAVFQNQQEVEQYERHVKGGHLGGEIKANLSIEHPLESKRIMGYN